MATTVFKQQCPSCEALVPIRDLKLVGRKIDCPKCKYRFVVEEPEDDKPEEEDEAPAKKGKNGVAKGKNGAVKSKADAKKGKGKSRGDDEEKPKKKKAASASNTTVLGIALAVVAVIALGIGAWSLGLFGGGSNKPKPVGPGPQGKPDQNASKDKDKPDNGNTNNPDKPVGDITNLLPPDSQVVVSAQMEQLLATPVGDIFLNNKSPFKKAAFAQKLGFAVDSIHRLVQAHNLDNRWIFTVIRTNEPYKKADIVAGLKLAQEAPINSRVYYTMKGSFDSIGNLLFKGSQPRDRFSVHLLDSQTIVFADFQVMEGFLKANGEFDRTSRPGDTGEKKDAPMDAPKDTPKDAPKDMPKPGPGNVRTPGIDMGKPDDKKSEKPSVPTGSYLTIPRHLKEVLDRVDNDSAALISVAGPLQVPADFDLIRLLKLAVQSQADGNVAALAMLSSGEQMLKPVQAEYLAVQQAFKKVNTFGFGLLALRARNKDGRFGAILGLDTGGDESAVAFEEACQKLQKKVKELMGNGPGPGPGPMTDRRDRPPGPMGRDRGPIGDRDRGPRDRPVPDRGPGGDKPPQPEFKFDINRHDTTVLFNVRTPLPKAVVDGVLESSKPALAQIKGLADLADSRSRIHELSAAIQRYVKAKGHFPRGTLPHDGGDRTDVPFDQRFSWMYELVPYLGSEYNELTNIAIDPTSPWHEKQNLRIAQHIVPTFLDRKHLDWPYAITYPGVRGEVATTNYVGVCGVDLDAARHSDKDPTVAAKLGVFGYDRVTQYSDVKNPAQTIVVLEVPSGPTDQKGPWVAGGGATLRGVSEDLESIHPFICATEDNKADGRPGTLAIMADGKVRFIPREIDPAIFRVMCTINGAKVDKLDELCPVVLDDGEAGPELKVDPNPPKKEEPKKDPPKEEPKKDAGLQAELEKLQGSWVAVSGEMGGQAVSDKVLQGYSLTLSGDSCDLRMGNAPVVKRTFQIDPTKDPKTLDFVVAEGAQKGKVNLAIYQFTDQRTLKICMAVFDKPRPTAFITQGIAGVSILEYKRPGDTTPKKDTDQPMKKPERRDLPPLVKAPADGPARARTLDEAVRGMVLVNEEMLGILARINDKDGAMASHPRLATLVQEMKAFQAKLPTFKREKGQKNLGKHEAELTQVSQKIATEMTRLNAIAGVADVLKDLK
jgi:uncharacterized protein (TIGR03067 family)